MKTNAFLVVVLLLMATFLFSYPVGEMVSFDLGQANVAGVTSDGMKIAGYYYPWAGVVSWTEEGGIVTVDTEAEAGAISDDGRIFGSKINPTLGHELPCYWDADNTYHELPHLDYGMNSDMFFSNVWSCNTSGTRLGGMQWTSTGGTTPVIWYLDDEENWQILDLMPDDPNSGRVNGVSEDGSRFAGWLAAEDGSWIPHVWTVDEEMNVTYEAAPAPAGWVSGEVSSFSQNGEYMTGYMNSMGVLWHDDGTYEMYQPENPSGWMNMSSVTVSNDGLCVGRTIDHQNWDQWAHVYKPGMGYMRADDYLNMFGTTYPDDYQFLDMIYWVSADESLMMGWYYDTNWGIKMFVLALPELSYIEGNVVLDGTIGSVEDVLISVGSTGTVPDETGYYSLTVGGGTYDITASIPGYITETINDVIVPEGTTVTGYDFTLSQIPNAGFIEGNLTQIYNWDSLTQATITADDGTVAYSTNGTEAGAYQIILPAGTYDITAMQNNCFEIVIEDVVVVANEVTQLDIEFISLSTPAFMQLDFVVDNPDTFDWSLVKIKVGDNNWNSTFSVWESSYSGEIWTPGTYTVSLWAPGYEIWTQDDVEFIMNETTSLSIPLVMNSYPVQDLTIENSAGTATWSDPIPVSAYYQDHELFQTDLDVNSNISFWSTPLWPNSNAYTTEEIVYEGSKSLKIDTIDGVPGDIYRDSSWPILETSTHIQEAMLYIPSGNCGHQGIIRNGVWEASFAIEIFYRADGTLDILIGGEEINLTYPQDQWFSFKLVSDLDNDVIEYYQDGELLANGLYSLDAHTGAASALTLGAYDISAESRPDFTETGLLYMDNFVNYTQTDVSEATYSVSLDGVEVATALDVNEYLFEGLTAEQLYTAGVTANYSWASSYEVTEDFTFSPITFDAPTNLAVDEATAEFTWNAPGTGGGEMSEGFEAAVPPAGWEAVVTNSAATWHQEGVISFSDGDITPQEGEFQAAVGWDYSAQDEWLITPAFEAGANLHFWSYSGAMGSTNLDHYYVKVSSDGGSTWEILWDAVTDSQSPSVWEDVNIDLSAYTGNIQLAWQAVDGDGAGLWFWWMLDDIAVTSATGRVISFDGELQLRSNKVAAITTTDADFSRSGDVVAIVATRDLIGYKVYLDGSEVAEVTETNYTFAELIDGTTYEAGVTAVYNDGSSEMVSVAFTYTPVDGDNNGVVAVTALNGNYPNPFNPTTAISFSVKEAGNVLLEVYNAKGQKIKTLVKSEMEAANHVVTWNGDDNSGKKVSSGIYFYKMKTTGYTSVKKMLLIK